MKPSNTTFLSSGNILATKIWIAQVFGIIQIIQILQAKSHKQNCLDQEIKERVKIIIQACPELQWAGLNILEASKKEYLKYVPNQKRERIRYRKTGTDGYRLTKEGNEQTSCEFSCRRRPVSNGYRDYFNSNCCTCRLDLTSAVSRHSCRRLCPLSRLVQ